MISAERVNNEKSVAGVLAEIKDEVKEFAQTRLEMLKAEMKEKMSSLKTTIPMIAIGLVFAVTSWFILTAALISLVAGAFYPSRFAYFFSLLIVGVIYLLIGVISATLALREIRASGMKPERTMRVLKQDQVWLQTEARQQA